MTLPIIDQPVYKHFLVGLGKEVKYRAFTLKEQKILLMAKESNETKSQVEAIKQIITLCTFGEVDVDDLSFFDIEDLFLRIRARSVGEICEIMYRDKETDKKYKVKIDLNDVKVQVDESHNRKIMINDSIGIMMRYPTLEMVDKKKLEDIKDDDFIRFCIECVFDENEVYYFNDRPEEEVNEWIENLNTSVLLKIQNFFETMPRLRHTVTLTLEEGKKETLHFEGIASFFI